MATDLTQGRLRELLNYDPETGVFRWKVRPIRAGYERADKSWNGRHAGKEAGDIFGKPPRYRIRIGEHGGFLSHRLAWLWMMGEWPSAEIDHIDMNPLNNAFRNLREATLSQNGMNRRGRGKYGKGVALHGPSGLFQARIYKNNKRFDLGYFKTVDGARLAYVEASKSLHGEFARTN